MDRQRNGKKEKDKGINENLQSTARKSKERATQTGVNSGVPEGKAIPAQLVAPVVVFLLQTRWQVINKGRAELWLRQTGHICDHWLHRYSNSQPCHGDHSLVSEELRTEAIYHFIQLFNRYSKVHKWNPNISHINV